MNRSFINLNSLVFNIVVRILLILLKDQNHS